MSSPTGPVRGIDFHKQQPLFVSGGDDYKIKVRLLFDSHVAMYTCQEFDRFEGIRCMFGKAVVHQIFCLHVSVSLLNVKDCDT